MTTIETGDSRRRAIFDAENDAADPMLHRDAVGTGGLVLIGPSAGVLPGLDKLLDAPNVGSVEAIGARMMSWKTASAETIEVGRSASRLIRDGQTAVVHLDSHIGDAPPVPVDGRDFVCARLGQIMIGIADVPRFVITHGERMTRALIIDSLDDPDAGAEGSIGSAYPLWRLSPGTMFRGLYVSMCPGDRPANAMVEQLAWFEGRCAT